MKNKFYIIAILLLTVFFLSGAKTFAQEEDKGKMSEQHRNNVAKVVEEIKKAADKDAVIGEEVKIVADEENETAKDVSAKMEMVEKRGGFKTFLIGSDYKNLGALRSELMTTQNHIDRMTKSLERSSSSEAKTDLEIQIKALDGILVKAQAFATDLEGKFSLFGWLVRMFK
jgi:hypothetical protein